MFKTLIKKILFSCASAIGKQGGRQTIHIGKDCRVIGTVEHETMHALGFIHEHSRPDRDKYLDVKWDNIEQGWNIFVKAERRKQIKNK